MKNFFFVLLSLISASGYSQISLKGIAIDADTKKSVPYSLAILNRGKFGAIANDKGYFEFSIPDSLINSSLEVSCLGYDTTKVKLGSLSKSDTNKISIHHKVVMLPEVSISSLDKNTLCKTEWGATKKPLLFDGSVLFGTGSEMAVFISNPKGDSGIISKLKFFIEDKGYPNTQFRAKLYYVSPKDNSPGEIMIDHDFILAAAKGDEWATIDISDFNIPIPKDGFFVSMEWLPASASLQYTITLDKNTLKGNGQVLGVSKEIKSNATWARSFLGNWIEVNDHNSNFSNPMIGAEVLMKCN